MRRILLVVLVLLGLSPGLLWRNEPRSPDHSQRVELTPLAFPADTRVGGRDGPLLTGAWRLTSPNTDFGSYSALVATGENQLLAISDRGQFLLDYIELLMNERVNEAEGFRHSAPTQLADAEATHVETAGLRAPARGRERWVVNKLRALNAWYSKGYEGGAQFRTSVNQAESVAHLRELIDQFFFAR